MKCRKMFIKYFIYVPHNNRIFIINGKNSYYLLFYGRYYKLLSSDIRCVGNKWISIIKDRDKNVHDLWLIKYKTIWKGTISVIGEIIIKINDKANKLLEIIIYGTTILIDLIFFDNLGWWFRIPLFPLLN